MNLVKIYPAKIRVVLELEFDELKNIVDFYEEMKHNNEQDIEKEVPFVKLSELIKFIESGDSNAG